MRGWAKEIMVTFSVVLALFLITVLETYVPVVRNILAKAGPAALFWMRFILIVLLAFFGYQTPNLKGLAGPRFMPRASSRYSVRVYGRRIQWLPDLWLALVLYGSGRLSLPQYHCSSPCRLASGSTNSRNDEMDAASVACSALDLFCCGRCLLVRHYRFHLGGISS